MCIELSLHPQKSEYTLQFSNYTIFDAHSFMKIWFKSSIVTCHPTPGLNEDVRIVL